jgi:hypothetical protein
VQHLHRGVGLARVMRSDSGKSHGTSARLQKDRDAGSHLDEVAQLLVLGISRANARRMAAQSRENSTGLCAGIERVLAPENGP